MPSSARRKSETENSLMSIVMRRFWYCKLVGTLHFNLVKGGRCAPRAGEPARSASSEIQRATC